jgi:cell wall-associated NlpC family hydrolase
MALSGCAAPRALHVVTVPVADVRSRPGTLLANREHDPLQETQVLYGERVRVVERRDAWARIEAIEQPEYSHAAHWEGYPGWVLQDALRPVKRLSPDNAVVTAKWATVRRSAEAEQPWFTLPMGASLVVRQTQGPHWKVELPSVATAWIDADQLATRKQLASLSPARRRKAVLAAAEQFVGDPYLWGGHSPHRAAPPTPITGVDCSGLVRLAYRTAGLTLPRDAHEQFLRSRRVPRPQPADLVFLSDEKNPDTIVHVMLYTGEGWLIESTGTGKAVRRIRVDERLYILDAQLRPGLDVKGQRISFGSYIR